MDGVGVCSKHYQKIEILTKSTFTCSKSKSRVQEQGPKSVQSHQLRNQNDASFVVLVSLFLTLNKFYTLPYNCGQN